MPNTTADHQPELLTITEAAELLRTPVASLRFWRQRNIGPRSFRLGRRVLYRRDDLHAWIDAQRDRGVTTRLQKGKKRDRRINDERALVQPTALPMPEFRE